MQTLPHLWHTRIFWKCPHLPKKPFFEKSKRVSHSARRCKKWQKRGQIWSWSGTRFWATKMELWKGFPPKRVPKSGPGPYRIRYGPGPLFGTLFGGNPFHNSILVAQKRVPDQDQIWPLFCHFLHRRAEWDTRFDFSKNGFLGRWGHFQKIRVCQRWGRVCIFYRQNLEYAEKKRKGSCWNRLKINVRYILRCLNTKPTSKESSASRNQLQL